MLRKDRRRCWGRTEEDAWEGQKKMVGNNRRSWWGRTEKYAGDGQK
jgi:hypothetical protein